MRRDFTRRAEKDEGLKTEERFCFSFLAVGRSLLWDTETFVRRRRFVFAHFPRETDRLRTCDDGIRFCVIFPKSSSIYESFVVLRIVLFCSHESYEPKPNTIAKKMFLLFCLSLSGRRFPSAVVHRQRDPQTARKERFCFSFLTVGRRSLFVF